MFFGCCLAIALINVVPIYAANKTEIKKINLDIRLDPYEDMLGLNIETKKDNYDVMDFEWKGGIEPGRGPAAKEEKAEHNTEELLEDEDYTKLEEDYTILGENECLVELCAADEYFFGTMRQKDIRLRGIESICTKAIRKDNGSTLLLTLQVPGVDKIVGKVEHAILSPDGLAEWESALGAYEYQVALYKDNKKIGRYHRTGGTSYNFSALIQEPGIYYYKIIPFSYSGKKGAASESSRMKIETEKTKEEQSYGWNKNEKGWWYCLEDGTYLQDNWLEDGGKWYFFDEDGYMLSNEWKQWKKKWYFLGEDGIMLIDTKTLDGFYVDVNGILIK